VLLNSKTFPSTAKMNEWMHGWTNEWSRTNVKRGWCTVVAKGWR
jgi:hypothetical protein